MKKILSFLILIFLNQKVFSQNKVVNCASDSIRNKEALIYMDSLIYKNKISGRFDGVSILLSGQYWGMGMTSENCFCTLLHYTKIFDFILRQGLNPSQRILIRPMLNSTDLPTTPEEEKNHLLFNQLNEFLEFRAMYERAVVKKYQSDPKQSLKEDVDNVIQYGLYSNPEMLRRILLSQYGRLPIEESNDDFINRVINKN